MTRSQVHARRAVAAGPALPCRHFLLPGALLPRALHPCLSAASPPGELLLRGFCPPCPTPYTPTRLRDPAAPLPLPRGASPVFLERIRLHALRSRSCLPPARPRSLRCFISGFPSSSSWTHWLSRGVSVGLGVSDETHTRGFVNPETDFARSWGLRVRHQSARGLGSWVGFHTAESRGRGTRSLLRALTPFGRAAVSICWTPSISSCGAGAECSPPGRGGRVFPICPLFSLWPATR